MRILYRAIFAVLLSTGPLAHADALADRAAIEAAAQAWIKAFNARDSSALLALTNRGAAFLDPAAPAPASRQDMARTRTSPFELGTETGEISISGDIAWRVAVLSQKLNGDVVRRSAMMEIWKRDDGAWKLHRQMTSGLLVPPKLFTRPDPSEPILDSPR